MGRLTDAELLQASRRGEHAAFGALVERYQGVVCAVSYSRTGDRALSEDVAQETFIAAWRQLDQLRETVKLRSWLCGIARNLARKARRRTDRETTLEGQLVFEGDSPFDDACDAETERVVREALGRVPETYRDALVLFYCEHLSAREIADTLEISEAAALQRLSRGRQYLADGVNDLVERALRGQRTRRKLAACVLAALPAAIPSRVDASTSSHGGTMLKLALIAGSLALTGTAAFVAHQSGGGATPTAVASAAAATPAPEPAASAPAATQPQHSTAPTLKIAPAADPDGVLAPDPDPDPTIDRATIDRLKIDRGPSRGPGDAPVTIVMFTDSLCPYCGKVLASIDELWDEYPGKLRLVIKQFPVHPTAKLAAEASFAADAQNKFWELHEQIFAHQDDLSHDALIEYARQAGLDVARFTSALDHHTYAAAVDADLAAAMELGVRATPSFLINGRRFVGARPVADMRATITAALADPR